MDLRPLNSILERSRSDIHHHSYIQVYEPMIAHKKFSCRNILMLGSDYEGTILMWHDYFPHATIYVVGKGTIQSKWYRLREPRIKILEEKDVYTSSFVKGEFIDKNIKFDLIFYDLNGSIDCYRWCLDLYLPLLQYNGMLSLEDIPDIAWCDTLKECVPSALQSRIHIEDSKDKSGKTDDILFIVNTDTVLENLTNAS